MTILEKVKETFKDCRIGTIFSFGEIRSMVIHKFGCNPESVIPSDYCYNRINNGIDFDNYLHIFEYINRNQYKYLGEGYAYTGKILHKPKGGYEVIVGEWKDGKVAKNDIIIKSNDRIVTVENHTDKISKDVHKTKRDISIKMRFDILKRDNFKCCTCGASPAKDPLVELHVDHIIPWSKGGETVFDNLQTLCSKCNIGKSNSL